MKYAIFTIGPDFSGSRSIRLLRSLIRRKFIPAGTP
jgi:hypothetical protein